MYKLNNFFVLLGTEYIRPLKKNQVKEITGERLVTGEFEHVRSKVEYGLGVFLGVMRLSKKDMRDYAENERTHILINCTCKMIEIKKFRLEYTISSNNYHNESSI